MREEEEKVNKKINYKINYWKGLFINSNVKFPICTKA